MQLIINPTLKVPLLAILIFSAMTEVLHGEQIYVGYNSLPNMKMMLSDTLKNQTQVNRSYGTSNFGLSVVVLFGLGHHDNLTKAKSTGQVQLKTSELNWTLYLQGGTQYKIIYGQYFLALVVPLPRTRIVNDYVHKGDVDEMGLLFRMRLLPWSARLSLFPVIGYSWLNETAIIYPTSGNAPNLLDTLYRDHAALFGIEASCILERERSPHHRIVFTYIHQNLKNEVDKYRIEWRKEWFGMEERADIKGGKQLGGIGYWSIGFQFVTWSDGRRDWFLTGSIGGEIFRGFPFRQPK